MAADSIANRSISAVVDRRYSDIVRYHFGPMIIDCHGHYTTAPKPLQDYRESQIAGLKDPSHVPSKGVIKITDDQIRESLEGAQLKFQRERGADVTIFSPRASAMSHHIGNET